VANRGSSDISGFVLDGATGKLVPISVPPPALHLTCTGSHLSSLSASPLGSLFVAIADAGSGVCTTVVTVTVLSTVIDPSTGALGQGLSSGWLLSLSSSDALDSATAVQADASGQLVYVTNSGHNLLQVAGDPRTVLVPAVAFSVSGSPPTGAMPVAIATIKQ
jgi:hypothetical protein